MFDYYCMILEAGTSIGFDIQKFKQWTNRLGQSSTNTFQLKDVICGIVRGQTHFCISREDVELSCPRCGFCFENIEDLKEHLSAFDTKRTIVINPKVKTEANSVTTSSTSSELKEIVGEAVSQDGKSGIRCEQKNSPKKLVLPLSVAQDKSINNEQMGESDETDSSPLRAPYTQMFIEGVKEESSGVKKIVIDYGDVVELESE